MLLNRPLPEYIYKLIMRDAELDLGSVLIICGTTVSAFTAFHTHWEWHITGCQDFNSAYKRYKKKLRANERAELMARLQRVPLIRAWNSMTSRISRAVSHHSDLNPQSRLNQITHLLTCWWQRRVGDYGYLEAIEIMEAEKEYWEAFHKSRQDTRAWDTSGSSLEGEPTKLRVGEVIWVLYYTQWNYLNKIQ